MLASTSKVKNFCLVEFKDAFGELEEALFHIVGGGGGDEERDGECEECFTGCGSSGNQLIRTARRGPLCYSQRSSAA